MMDMVDEEGSYLILLEQPKLSDPTQALADSLEKLFPASGPPKRVLFPVHSGQHQAAACAWLPPSPHTHT